MHAQQRHPQYRQRPRRNPGLIIGVTAAIVVAPIVAVIVVVMIAFSRSPEAAGYDQATIRACEAAKRSMEGDGQASWRWAAESIKAASASGEPALRELAESYAPDGTEWGEVRAAPGASEISKWCGAHDMG